MTIRDRIKPFVIVDFEEGASLHLYSVEDYKIELFESRKTEGFTGNGYDWTALAKKFIDEEMPDIMDELEFEPDYGLFTVHSDSAILLEAFAMRFKAALDDNEYIYPFFMDVEAWG